MTRKDGRVRRVRAIGVGTVQAPILDEIKRNRNYDGYITGRDGGGGRAINGATSMATKSNGVRRRLTERHSRMSRGESWNRRA